MTRTRRGRVAGSRSTTARALAWDRWREPPHGEGVWAGAVVGSVGAHVGEVGVERGDPYGKQAVVEELGHRGPDTVVECRRGQCPRFHGAGSDRRVQAQAEDLVAVTTAAPRMADCLSGGEGERDAFLGGVGTVATGADVRNELVEGAYGGLVEGGCGHAGTAEGSSAEHSS